MINVSFYEDDFSLDFGHFYAVLEFVTSEEFDGCVLAENFELVTRTIEAKGELHYNKLDQIVLSVFECMRISKNHHLFPGFNENIMHLVSGGIIDHYVDSYTKHRYITEKPVPPGPVVLTMDRLGIGFQIWASMLAISFVVFILELFCFWVKSIYKR